MHPLVWLLYLLLVVTLVDRWFFWLTRLSGVRATGIATLPLWIRALKKLVGEFLITIFWTILVMALGFAALWYLIDFFGPIRPIHEW